MSTSDSIKEAIEEHKDVIDTVNYGYIRFEIVNGKAKFVKREDSWEVKGK